MKLLVRLDFDSFGHDLPAVVLLMQTDDESDDQSNQAGNHNHSYNANSPPSTSLRYVCVVPQILEFLSFRTRHIP